MFKNYANGEEYYNKIYLLFNFFIALSLTPFSYLLLLRQSGDLITSNLKDNILFSIIASLLISAIVLTWFALKKFKERLSRIDKKLSFRVQLNIYFTISLHQYATFLLSQFLCVAGLYITNSSFFVVGYVLSVIVQSIKRPTLNAIIEHLGLSKENEQILIEKTAIE